jgi:diguanylate cyclase (GGDEF)-like protein
MSRDLERGIKERQNLEGRLSRIKTRGKKVRQLAFHDQVTGLPNRTLFNDRLDHALAQAERHAWNVVVMFIDLDKFKPVNDRYGHDVGDRALQMVAQRLQGLVRAVDTVSRYGGDEFLCMMSEIEDREDIATVAQKVLSNIAVPYEIDGLKIMVSSSIGIAIYPSNGETAEVLLKKADAAMYRAKQNHSGYLFAEDESALGKVAAPPHRVAESSKRKTQKSGLTAVPDNTAIKNLASIGSR